MKVIFISGPYRSTTEHGLYLNIERAREEALFVWKSGGVALCPHTNTAFFGGECPDEVWLSGDLELLYRCDAIYMIPGWEKSSGAKAELQFSMDHGKRVIFSRDGVIEYLSVYHSGVAQR